MCRSRAQIYRQTPESKAKSGIAACKVFVLLDLEDQFLNKAKAPADSGLLLYCYSYSSGLSETVLPLRQDLFQSGKFIDLRYL